MSRLLLAALVTLEVLCGCHRPLALHRTAADTVPERIPSSEVSMTVTWGWDTHVGTTLEITLRNVGRRVLVFDTGMGGYSMADFAFSLQLPDHHWLQLHCHLCTPGSFTQPTPYTIRLSPSQFVRFTAPLSTFVASDPHTGKAIDLNALHGHMLIELGVPTPPGTDKRWPGYISASVPLP